MRYKNEISRLYSRLEEEVEELEYKKEHGINTFNINYYKLEEEQFYRIFNTISWLMKFNYPKIKVLRGRKVHKPNNEEILEVLEFIEIKAKSNIEKFKNHHNKSVFIGLYKHSEKDLLAVEYYRKLVQEGFYTDKEIVNEV